jgi:hypothetical protein
MPIVGVLANAVSASTGGNIVGDTSTLTHHFGSSSIWGHPALQSFSTEDANVDDQPGSVASVSQFVDVHGTHNVNFIGVFASQCTSITYQMVAFQGGSAEALCITEFFG